MTTAALLALAVLFVLDALSTIYVIQRQGGREVNPIMVLLMDMLGVRGALLVSKVALLGALIYLADAFGRWLWLLALVYLCVVLWNVRQIILARYIAR